MSKKLLMLQGLPGSGKSYFAEKTGFQVVNKDSIRRNLEADGWEWSRENEKDVIAKRDSLISRYLRDGYSVVSDDTNFGRKHKVRLEQLARENGAEFEIKRIDTPLDICLGRNAQREGKAKVPESAILSMYEKYVANDVDRFPLSAKQGKDYPFEKVERKAGLPEAIICDLDGTISMFKEKGHRGPYDASKCDQDEYNPIIGGMVQFYRVNGLIDQIIFVSGREEIYREPTERWLKARGFADYKLYMRKAGDHRKDWLVKYELFNENIRDKYNVAFCLDDRNQVVKMWRAIGLTCLQVANGDF